MELSELTLRALEVRERYAAFEERTLEVLRSRSRHRGGTHASRVPLYGRGMEEARSVLERLERIESMRRANAGPVELLEELRALLQEAEAWAREEGGDAGSSAVGQLRAALARDMIGA